MSHVSSNSSGPQHHLTQSALRASSAAASPGPAGRYVGASEVGAGSATCLSEATTASTNPSIWDNNIPRKMLDMQYQFSANPLRVADCGGKHWTRLTATYKSMIPQPGGGVKILKQKYPRVTDETLYRQVASSGVSKPKPERTLPPLPDRRDVNTPLLRERLAKAQMAPLPRPPKLVLVANRPIKDQLEEFHANDDGSSCFSTTTVASVSHLPRGGGGPRSRTGSSVIAGDEGPSGASHVSGGAAPSAHLGGGVRKHSDQNKKRVHIATSASSHASSRASRTSRVTQLQNEILLEKATRQQTEDRLSEVAESLTRVEAALLARKEE